MLFDDANTAGLLIVYIMSLTNLVGGFMMSLDGIFQKTPQRYIAWLTFFSPVRYGFFGMMSAQFPITD